MKKNEQTGAEEDGRDILAAAPGAAMLASLVDGVIIIDSGGVIRYANAAAARMFGRDPAELFGASVELLMPAATATRHQGYVETYLRTGEGRIVGRGRAVEGIGRDGRPVHIHLAVAAFEYRGARHFIGITHDRTAETLAAQELHENLDRLRRCQHHGGIGSWAWTVGSGDVYWSETIGPMFGFPPGERQVPVRALMARIHPEDRGAVLAATDSCVRSGRPCRAEHRAVQPDGTIRWLMMEGDCERDAAGHARRLLGVVRDITTAKAMERDLIAARDAAERASRAQSEFISSMSHEIRTPLNAILGYAELLQSGGGHADGKAAAYARSILDAGRHLLTLVNDVLDLAAIESGRLALSIEPVALAPAVGKAVELVALMAARKSIAIVDRSADESVAVMADAGRLRQVLVNLLSNAVKYNFDQGRVTIAVAVGNGDVRIDVADTGPGIALERQADVFRRFARLGAERSSIEGAGIGLALTRHLVEAMDGAIDFVSAPGQGSRFWITLPAAPTDRRPVPASSPAAEPGYHDGAHRILVVEDNPMNFEILSEVLKALGDFRIDWARHSDEVQAHVAVARPDLVFLDINLPGEDGFAVARRLRGLLGASCPPLFGLSANAFDDARQRAAALGFTGYIAKPFRIDQIRAALDHLS